MKIRTYYRQPLIQEAVLKIHGNQERPCEIRNFCPAGLFLKINPAQETIDINNREDEAEIIFKSTGKGEIFAITGRLSHSSPQGAGFVFSVAPPFPLLQALQEKAIGNRLEERKAPAELVEIHEHCLQAFEAALIALLENLFKQFRFEELSNLQIEDEFGKGDANLDDFKAFSLQLNVVGNAFYQQSLEQAKSFIVPDLSLQPEVGAVYSPSRPQKLLFEDWMNLIDKVIQLENKYEAILNLLKARFSVIAQRTLDNRDNPFAPNVLMHSFHYSLMGVILSNSTRNTIYSIFSNILDHHLQKLYSDLRVLSKPIEYWKNFSSTHTDNQKEAVGFIPVNNNLNTISHDSKSITNNSKNSIHELNPSSVPAGISEFNHHSTPLGAAQVIAGERMEQRIEFSNSSLTDVPKVYPGRPSAFTTFVVLARYIGISGESANFAAVDTYKPEVIIRALVTLRNQSKDNNYQYFSAPALNLNLRNLLSETGEESCLYANQIVETFHLIGFILDTILSNKNLPRGIIGCLKKMQLPLLIGSIQNPDLLYSHSHPARDIINKLDFVNLACNSNGDIENQELANSLNHIIDKIFNEVDTNENVFSNGLEAIENLTAPLIFTHKARIEKVVESCEGVHRLEKARRFVDQEIHMRLVGKPIPVAFKLLLDVAWKQTLVLTYLRQGNENDDWRRHMDILNFLLNRIKPNNHDRENNDEDTSSLKSFLLDRLSSSGSNPGEIQSLVEQIFDLCNKNLPRIDRIEFIEISSSESPEQGAEESQLNRLKGFQLGNWIKFELTPSNWVSLNLAWIGNDPSRFVFVNRKGIRALDIYANQFIKLLDEKKAIRINSLNESSLLERTASIILLSLREHLH